MNVFGLTTCHILVRLRARQENQDCLGRAIWALQLVPRCGSIRPVVQSVGMKILAGTPQAPQDKDKDLSDASHMQK